MVKPTVATVGCQRCRRALYPMLIPVSVDKGGTRETELWCVACCHLFHVPVTKEEEARTCRP
jgi:hypothetical protein